MQGGDNSRLSLLVARGLSRSSHPRRAGLLLQVVREHYLRDDIGCGSHCCKTCNPEEAKLSEIAKRYLVIDTNIALQQVRQPLCLGSPLLIILDCR